MKILFIGNSKTYRQNFPGIFKRMVEASGEEIEIEQATKAGASLMELSQELEVLEKIKSKKWDFIVLQERTIKALQEDMTEFEIGTKNIFEKIKESNPETKIIYHAVGVYSDYDKEQQKITNQHYEKMAQVTDGIVSYTGSAMIHFHDKFPKIELYEDKQHPSLVGAYLAACCLYGTIYNIKSANVKYYDVLNPAIAKELQKVADETRKQLENFKLVLFSDIHYAPELPINNGSSIDRKLIQYAIPLLQQLMKKINYVIKPDVVINLGDMIEDFNDYDKDIVNLNFIWNQLKNIKVPFYSIIGNHDLRSMNSRKEVEDIIGMNNSTFSINIKGYHLVFLGLYVNNEINGDKDGAIAKTQFISEEDLKWLDLDLTENKLPSLVFCHFGVAEDTMKGNWWFENCPEYALLGNRKRLKEILKKDRNVLAVFSGHQHWSKKLIEEQISYYVIGSLTEDINGNGIPDGVYFEVDIKDKKIDVKEHHLRL